HFSLSTHTSPSEIYTLSLHDALPISQRNEIADQVCGVLADPRFSDLFGPGSLGEAPLAATLSDGRVIAGTADRLLIEDAQVSVRSEEHTSELQSLRHLVCRLLLEKKK